MEIRWSPQAADDIEHIFSHIQNDNPAAARKVVTTIHNCGRPSRIEGRRELLFRGLSYIVVYRVRAEVVEISRIYRTAQNWP